MTIQMDDQNDFLAVHEDIVKRVQDKQPDDEYLYELADLFKVRFYMLYLKVNYVWEISHRFWD